MGAVTDFSTPYIYNSEMTIGEMLIGNCQELLRPVPRARCERPEGGAWNLKGRRGRPCRPLLESDIKEIVGEDGTEEELFAALEETYVSRELYELHEPHGRALFRAYNMLYGGTGEKLTEQEVRDFADEYSFMTAKHILIQTTDAEGRAHRRGGQGGKAGRSRGDIPPSWRGKSGQGWRAPSTRSCRKRARMGARRLPGRLLLHSGRYGNRVFRRRSQLWSPPAFRYSGEQLRLSHNPAHAAHSGGQGLAVRLNRNSVYDKSRGRPANLYEARLNGWIENAETVWAAEFEDLDLNGLFDLN